MSGPITRTGGREATEGLIEGEVALAVGMPDKAPPSGWQWRKLTDLSRLETGHTPSRKKPEYWDGDIPWIGIRDATGNHGRTLPDTIQHVTQAGIDNSSARVLPAHTVCLSRTASVGFVVVMGREMATSQDFVNWVCDEKQLDYRFLKYVLLAEQRSFSRFAHGTTHQTIYFPEVKAFHICAPEIEEQRAIADVLSSLDDKIEQNRRAGAKLEGLARGVFKAWFVDFEPVKAKAAGATALPGMPPETFAALPNRFTDSPLGPVPQGWEQATLRELAEFITGGTPSKKEPAYWGGDFPWVSAKDMHGRIISDSELRLTDAGRGSVRRLAPRHATLMVIRGMSLMTEVRIGWCTREVAFNQDLRAFIARDGIPAEFIHLWLTSSEEQLMQIVDTASHGTGRILTDRLDSMSIARPSDVVIRAFAEVSRPMMALRETLHAESAKLAALRDYLLPRLLSGRVRVCDAGGDASGAGDIVVDEHHVSDRVAELDRVAGGKAR